MPGFVPSPETVRVLLHWTLHGRPELNVFHGHFATVGPLNPASAQNIFNAIAASAVSSGYFAGLATTVSLISVGVIDLRTQGVPEVRSTGTAVAGTDVSPALPDQVSFVYTLRTARTGRSHRGRVYSFGWGTDNVLATGEANASTATAGRTWFLSLRTAMNGEGMPMAIRSPALPVRPSKPGGDLPAKAYEITEVTDIEIRDHIFDTNRRRTDLLRR